MLAAAQRRRTELALLRVAARRQLVTLLAVEYTLVAAVAVAGGVALGLAVTRRMLSFLAVTETGARVVPPFVIEVNLPALAGMSAAGGGGVVTGHAPGKRAGAPGGGA